MRVEATRRKTLWQCFSVEKHCHVHPRRAAFADIILYHRITVESQYPRLLREQGGFWWVLDPLLVHH